MNAYGVHATCEKSISKINLQSVIGLFEIMPVIPKFLEGYRIVRTTLDHN